MSNKLNKRIAKKLPILKLYEPYIHGEWAFWISSIGLWVIFIPILRTLMVIFPEKVLNSLANDNNLTKTILLIVLFQTIFTIIPIYEDFYNSLIRDRALVSIEAKINRGIYNKVLKTDYSYVDNPDFYDNYMWVIENQAQKSREAFELINEFISGIIVIIFMGTIIALSNGWIILFTIAGASLRMIGYLKYNDLDVQSDEEMIKDKRIVSYVQRVFYLKEYGADLRTTNISSCLLNLFNKKERDLLKTVKKYGIKKTAWAVYADIIYRIFYATTIVFVVINIYHGKIGTAAEYITIMLAVDKLDEVLYTVFSLFQSGIKLNRYSQKILKFYENQSTIENDINEGKIIVGKKAFDIKVNKVTFKYPNSDFEINNLNLHIMPGEHIAIVGENGVGKSTLVKLLLRLYDPVEGAILINNVDLKDLSLKNYRNRVGVVFQNANIYGLTVRENLSVYENVDDECLINSLRMVSLSKIDEDIQNSLNRMMTREFDENGIVLSGGEAQKLSLARVLGHAFGLLILDEPSSALDPIAEYNLNQLLLKSFDGITTVMIAHRLSGVRNLDRIIVMGESGIVEEGNHDELMRKRGAYYRMFTAQAENYNE